jgi:AraC family transcriptional regulator of adaptative response/methylated-DNA-[protein]-cysteine methyltransferase
MNIEQCWQDVLARNPATDGEFVYAVRSTGIYCRPTCSSRRPNRDQVQFFADPASAEQAGFRACRRCEPNANTAPQIELVQDICRYIDAHIDETLTLDALGTVFHLSPAHLQRLFTRTIGLSPRAYSQAQRAERLKTTLRQDETVADALYEAGYGSSRGAYENTPLGMTPATYRKGGVGLTIYYATVPCALGYVLVAATKRGVCTVQLGDSVAMLETELAQEFPAATCVVDESQLSEAIEWLLSYLAGQPIHIQLPLDIQATAFQRRVWQALRAIPYGETRAYAELAVEIGNPKATRAVARACATNPVALVIPCHRVIGSDGRLSGYRWGIERKQALLDQETRHSAPAHSAALSQTQLEGLSL